MHSWSRIVAAARNNVPVVYLQSQRWGPALLRRRPGRHLSSRCHLCRSLAARSWPTFLFSFQPSSNYGLHVSIWFALFAPKQTPKAVINQLNAAVVDALATPTVRQRLSDLGFEIPSRDQQTPEALRAYQKAEIEKWWPIIKAANIKGE
jgi:hypothetical protein